MSKKVKVNEPSLRTSSPDIHRLPMKGTEYFAYIMSGKKKFEGRVLVPACQSMQVKDFLCLFDRRAKWGGYL